MSREVVHVVERRNRVRFSFSGYERRMNPGQVYRQRKRQERIEHIEHMVFVGLVAVVVTCYAVIEGMSWTA